MKNHQSPHLRHREFGVENSEEQKIALLLIHNQKVNYDLPGQKKKIKNQKQERCVFLGKEISLLEWQRNTKTQIKPASWSCLVLVALCPKSMLRISIHRTHMKCQFMAENSQQSFCMLQGNICFSFRGSNYSSLLVCPRVPKIKYIPWDISN